MIHPGQQHAPFPNCSATPAWDWQASIHKKAITNYSASTSRYPPLHLTSLLTPISSAQLNEVWMGCTTFSQHPRALVWGARTRLQEMTWKMSPKGASHHPDVGADRQQAPQSQGKGKPSTTTAPAAKGRHWDIQTVLLQERYHTGTTPPG